MILNPKDQVGRGKVPLHLVPPAALIVTAMALRDGAEKYGPFNWRSTPIHLTSYLDAMLRHIVAIIDGEDVATDSGVDHLGHVSATAAIVIDARACGTLIDDRPKPGRAPQLLQQMREMIAAKERTAA